MTELEIKTVIDHIADSWPLADIKGLTPAMWAKELKPLADVQCAVLAVDALRRTHDYPPGAASFLEQYKAIHDYAHEKPKQLTAPVLQESAYLREARKLIFGPGAQLLETPVSELSVEDAGIKAKVLDCAQRHRLVMESGRMPDANMLVEVSQLGEAVMTWGEKHDLEGERVQREQRRERQQQEKAQRHAAAAKPRARGSRR